MSNRLRPSNARPQACRKALLPVALAMVLGSMSAHAATTWVPTQTHAALLKVAAPAVAASAMMKSIPSGYALNVRGTPQLSNTLVTPLENSKPLNVAVSLNLRNTAQLSSFLHDVRTIGTASYGKFLTPAQFKASYAPTDAQVQAVVAHLQQSGFTHITVAPNNLFVYAQGSASNAAAGFNATMKQFTGMDGKQKFGNDAPAMVPQALGGIVGSVQGLENISVPHTMNHRFTQATASPQATAGVVAHSPTEFPAIYDAGKTLTAYATTVGVITWGDMTQVLADLNIMAESQLIDLSPVTVVPVPLGAATTFTDAGDGTEWDLDTQTIIGTSGGVKELRLYAAANGVDDADLTNAGITAAYNQAVVDNLAKVINVSLGEDETGANQDGTMQADDAVFQQAASQGQTFSISSGDEGVYQATDGEIYTNGGAPLPGVSLSAYSVSEPATSPYVVAVGGTSLTTDSNDAWAGETVWNSGLAVAQDGNQRIEATGGGVSKFEPVPSWESTALGSTLGKALTGRVLPDIAFDADPASGALVVTYGYLEQIGGTSLASPMFVGFFARMQTTADNTIPLPTSEMYRDLPTHATLLHDVTVGNNGIVDHGTTYGYNAAVGWDRTTGYGSMDIAKMSAFAATNWGAPGVKPAPVPPPPPPTVLTNRVAVTTQGNAGNSKQFTIVVPAGVATINLRTYAGSGDVSLYVKFGSAASATAYDFASVHPNTNNESVTIRSPKAGTYYMTVTSPKPFAGVNVQATY